MYRTAIGHGCGHAGVEVQALQVGYYNLFAVHDHAFAAAECDGQAVADTVEEGRSGKDAVGKTCIVAIHVVGTLDIAGQDERIGIGGAIHIGAVDEGVAGGGVYIDGEGVDDAQAVYRQGGSGVARRQMCRVNEIACSWSGSVDVRRLKHPVVKCFHCDLNSLVLSQCLSDGQQCNQHDAQCKT